MDKQALVSGIQLALRASVGASAAYAVAEFCKLPYPIYALISTIIVTDLLPAQTRSLSLQRLMATVAGAACGAIIRSLLGPSVWAIGLGVMAAMTLCHLSPIRNGAKVAGYICGLVITTYGDHPWSYAYYRFIETVLGIGVAWLISLVPKVIRFEENGKPPTDKPDPDSRRA